MLIKLVKLLFNLFFMKPYHSNIEKDTLENDNFRKVVWTGKYLQVVLMTLKPGEDIGVEVHDNVDQFFRVESGEGKAVINGEEFILEDGVSIVVPAGVEHNLINIGSEPMRLYTIYTPPNHIDGRVHETKADAIADTEDEDFGHAN